MNQAAAVAQEGRTARLKAATTQAHAALDARIMAAEPFASPARYGCFLAAQYRFHALVDPLHCDRELAKILPDLASRRRLHLVAQDLADLGMPVPASAAPVSPEPGLACGLGWLYVAEGSNLGAAFLIREAAALGFSETFGARHLAAAPEGRARHWRAFTSAIDDAALTAEEDAQAIAGARAAFDAMRGIVEAEFA